MWYMPPVVGTAPPVYRLEAPGLVFVLIAAFLAIDGFGLCITYGQLVAAWRLQHSRQPGEQLPARRGTPTRRPPASRVAIIPRPCVVPAISLER